MKTAIAVVFLLLLLLCVLKGINPFYALVATLAIYPWAAIVGRRWEVLRDFEVGIGFASGFSSVIALSLFGSHNPDVIAHDVAHAGFPKTFIVFFASAGLLGAVICILIFILRGPRKGSSRES